MVDNNSKLEKLKALVERRPDEPFPRYGLAMEYRNQGELVKALDVLHELIERIPSYVPTYYQYGGMLREAGNIDAAREFWTQGVAAAEAAKDIHSKSELLAVLQELAD